MWCKRTVDGIIHPLVQAIDLCAEILRIEVECSLVRGELVVELAVEHPDDLRALVVDDLCRLLVPQHRDGEPTAVVRLDFEIQVLDVLCVVNGVDFCVGEGVNVLEWPAILAHPG